MGANSYIFNFERKTIYLIFKAIIFLVTIVVLDRTIGTFCNNLFNRTSYPLYAKLRYSIDSVNQDLIFLGSSKASDQFIPSVITNRTGMSAYNLGFPGQGLKFSYVQLFEIIKRYNPKIVLLDVAPNIILDPESQEKFKLLLPYFKRDTLMYNAITNGKVIEKLKFLSSIYPYNSSILDLIRGSYFRKYKDTLNGFEPLDGVLDTTDIIFKVNRQFNVSNIPYSKIIYLKEIIKICTKNNIRIIIVISPIYKPNENFDEMISKIRNIALCQSKQTIFWDMSKDSVFLSERELFHDNIHLNYKGARLYSSIIATRLNELLSK
jgi:hypothetical protein